MLQCSRLLRNSHFLRFGESNKRGHPRLVMSAAAQLASHEPSELATMRGFRRAADLWTAGTSAQQQDRHSTVGGSGSARLATGASEPCSLGLLWPCNPSPGQSGAPGGRTLSARGAPCKGTTSVTHEEQGRHTRCLPTFRCPSSCLENGQGHSVQSLVVPAARKASA